MAQLEKRKLQTVNRKGWSYGPNPQGTMVASPRNHSMTRHHPVQKTRLSSGAHSTTEILITDMYGNQPSPRSVLSVLQCVAGSEGRLPVTRHPCIRLGMMITRPTDMVASRYSETNLSRSLRKYGNRNMVPGHLQGRGSGGSWEHVQRATDGYTLTTYQKRQWSSDI